MEPEQNELLSVTKQLLAVLEKVDELFHANYLLHREQLVRDARAAIAKAEARDGA